EADAAVFLGERDGKPAELGELRPVLGHPALLDRADLAAILEGIFVAHEALRGFLQLLLLVGQGQIHLCSSGILWRLIDRGWPWKRCSSEPRCCRRRSSSCAC